MDDQTFESEYARIIGEFIEAVGPEGMEGHSTGCFFLLYQDSPWYPGAYLVTWEPAFEVEFRTRMDSNTNPTASFAILPWG